VGNPKFGDQVGDPALNPSTPSYGLLQADFVYQEDVDSGHPLNLDYFIPINCQTVKTARLSFRLRLYRTYSSLSGLVTGAETGHTHSHAHTSAAHTHSIHFVTGASAANLAGLGAGGNVSDNTVGAAYDTAQIVNSTTPGNTGTNAQGSSGHTHNVTGTSSLGVTEDVNNNPSYTVSFDGVDHTADIIPAGPYATDQVELDVTKFISTVVDRAWHVISLGPSARGRLQAVLRVLYNSNLV
jgi:hypothetical protein